MRAYKTGEILNVKQGMQNNEMNAAVFETSAL